ncbi:MAG: hypothetical protein RL254_1907, partial [Planctomycetota bacterium]
VRFHGAQHWIESALLEGESFGRFIRQLPGDFVSVDRR